MATFGRRKQSQVYQSKFSIRMIMKESEENGMSKEMTVHKNSLCLALVLLQYRHSNWSTWKKIVQSTFSVVFANGPITFINLIWLFPES